MNDTFPKAVAIKLADIIDYAAGGVVSKQILKNEKGNITLFSFDKGQGLSEHTAPFNAFVQVLEGVGEIVIDKQAILVETGESIIMPANISHAVNAVESFKMLLTMIKD